MKQQKIIIGEPVHLDSKQEVEITNYIAEIVKSDNLYIYAYNICQDHIHLILKCVENQRDAIICRLKGKSTQFFKQNHNIKTSYHLWAQKYNFYEIDNDQQLVNTIEYIRYNRRKHNLPPNRDLKSIVPGMLSQISELLTDVV